MASLYDLTGELLELLNMLENEDIDQEVVNDTLEAVNGEYELKMEDCCKAMKNLEGDIASIKAEIERLTEKKKRLENGVERLKTYMFNSMKAVDKTKIKGELFTLSIRRNGGKAPVIMDVEDTSELPDELVKIEEKPDMDAIRKLLDSGETCKYAHYGERGESLSIK